MIAIFKNFAGNKKGAVAIEFYFMILFLGLIFAFMVDLVSIRSTLGKLDHASYTMVNLLRERKQLADNKEGITSGELIQYRQLAKLLLFGDKNSKGDVKVVLEYKATNGSRMVQGDTKDCAPYQNLDTLWAISPYSESSVTGASGRKVPLYQVTLCMQLPSLFRALIVNDQTRHDKGVRSSSFSITR